jgi:MATE family multidrug resistance protein
MVDTALAGHMGDAVFLGGLALGGTIFSFLFWGFGFLRMGTTGLCAQAWGADQKMEGQAIFARGISVAIVGGLLIILSQKPLLSLALQVLEASEEAEYWASIYFLTRIWAAPATLMLYVLNGWMLGAQNAVSPLWVTLAQNLGNVAFSLFFVLQFDLKLQGVALGTVVGNYTALGLALWLMKRRYPWLFGAFQKQWFNKKEIGAFFSLNTDIFIRTLALIAAFTWFTAESATYGDVPLAANSILMQLWLLFSYGIDGFAYAAESLTGKYKGANNVVKLHKTIRLAFIWGAALGIGGGLIYLAARNPILSIFTNDLATINQAKELFSWMIFAPFIGSFCYIWDGIYIGLTASAAMRNSMLFSAVLIYFPTYFLFQSMLGIHALWLALTAFLAARALSQWYLFHRYQLAGNKPST